MPKLRQTPTFPRGFTSLRVRPLKRLPGERGLSSGFGEQTIMQDNDPSKGLAVIKDAVAKAKKQ